MAGEYEKAITILQAIRNIDDRSFLLPAIQRNFVWDTQQICVLFDSLMRGYPINSFMMWDVKSQDIKDRYRFYSFLANYCQRFNEANDHVTTKGDFKDFMAIIDGQQRLTAIFIGLKGSYAYKQPRVWWPNTIDDKILPPRKLYLDLKKSIDDAENESLMHHHFRFLTKKQVQTFQENSEAHWFEIGQILSLPEVGSVDEIPFTVVMPYLKEQGLEDNLFAQKTLTRLYFLVREERTIHYYKETSQEIDHILDIFIRTNSGGTALAFSDLLMSIAIANWEGDARKDIDNLVKKVRQDADMGFSIGRDWVLKTCLMLTGADVKFRVKNFDIERVNIIQSQWSDIHECITEAFRLVKRFGLSDQSLSAKNAVIPIAYYLYKQQNSSGPIYKNINKLTNNREERDLISKWLYMALLKGIFGGTADSILTKMRQILNRHWDIGKFPLEQIITEFTATSKDLRFDNEYLHGLLETQYGDSRCRPVLALICPEINEIQQLHIDHLHPASAFKTGALKQHDFLTNDHDAMTFFGDPKKWNSVVNLHLLNSSLNLSKSDEPLEEWMKDNANGFQPADIFLKETDSLAFKDFRQFFDARHTNLLAKLRSNVVVSSEVIVTLESFDEEDDEEAYVE